MKQVVQKPPKRLIFMISTKEKTTREVSQEAMTAVQKYKKAMLKAEKEISKQKRKQ